MREAQKAYYNNPSKHNLIAAKQRESDVVNGLKQSKNRKTRKRIYLQISIIGGLLKAIRIEQSNTTYTPIAIRSKKVVNEMLILLI